MKKLDLLLEDLNATFVHEEKTSYGSETFMFRYYRWKDRFIRVSDSIQLGITFDLSDAGVPLEKIGPDWSSIYTFTVERFDSFTEDESIQWIVSIPEEREAYISFLGQHVQKLIRLKL